MNTRIGRAVGLLAIVILLISACGIGIIRGSGNLVTESRNVSDFDRVDLSGSGEVVIIQGEEESLTVEADDNIMPYVTTEVRGGTLQLALDAEGARSISPTRLRFTVGVKDLAGLEVSGSGSATSTGIDTERLDIDVSGSGDVRIDSLAAEAVGVQLSGSGDVELRGEVTRQDIDINGSGKYIAGDLGSQTATVAVSGSGDATVWVTESLDAHIGGSGSVNYYGTPQTSFSGDGSEDIHRLGDK